MAGEAARPALGRADAEQVKLFDQAPGARPAVHLLGCFPFGFEQLRDGFISPPGLGQPSGHVNEVQGAALPGQGAHGTLVRLLNGDEFESPRVELATTLVVRDSTARLG